MVELPMISKGGVTVLLVVKWPLTPRTVAQVLARVHELNKLGHPYAIRVVR